MGKYNVVVPQYTDTVAKIAAMVTELGTATESVTLYCALAALRNNLVEISTDDNGQDTAKGVNAAARELGVAAGTITKGVKVLLARVPEMLDAEAAEIRDRVLAFLVSLAAGGETLTSVYNSLKNGGKGGDDPQDDGEQAFDQAKAVALFATAIAYAAKFGQDSDPIYAQAKGK